MKIIKFLKKFSKMSLKKIKNKIKNLKYGKNCKIFSSSNIFDCEIGDNIFVSPFFEIQKNYYVGNNTRISSHISTCSHVKIWENCFIRHGVALINDKFCTALNYKEKKNKEKIWLKKTIIKNNAQIGSGACILPIEICSDVIIGTGSVVTKDIS
jgi:acetyltransferase-like isoleucine patch superfamily enzyme